MSVKVSPLGRNSGISGSVYHLPATQTHLKCGFIIQSLNMLDNSGGGTTKTHFSKMEKKENGNKHLKLN